MYSVRFFKTVVLIALFNNMRAHVIEKRYKNLGGTLIFCFSSC